MYAQRNESRRAQDRGGLEKRLHPHNYLRTLPAMPDDHRHHRRATGPHHAQLRCLRGHFLRWLPRPRWAR